ncbi:MAG: acetate--CoA ligase family protein [Candidatus Aenigmarchaeota archaeon]|nr:acetate--CoA ligase family protein [Candidatus Aenigmarchaeota archaeon]
MKIPDHAAYELLAKYGIAAAKWSFARNLREAELAAENLNFPIILKIDSPGVMHKQAAGCVRTVFHRDHLRKMFETVVANAKRQTKQINGVIMQELVYSNAENVHELIVGAKRDPQFGPVIMFGAGGRLTDEKDVCFRLVPISKSDARDMLSEPKISKLITRKNKVAGVLLSVSKMMEFENISELDINPLMVSDRGILAADVRIVV